MRFSGGLAGIAAAVFVIGAAAIPAARAADSAAGRAATVATPGTTLYVNADGGCSDSGPGTLADPYCTVQAAANVVDPGQTVDIIASDTAQSRQSVTITRSGTPTEPITFTWSGSGPTPTLSPMKQTGRAVVTLKDVHDVTLSHLEIENFGTDDGIDVIGSSDISLSTLWIVHIATTQTPASAAISIDGTSSDVTVSRTIFDESPLWAVRSSQGASRVTLTTNAVWDTAGSGFTLDGTADAVVTSNTILADNVAGTCANAPAGITLADGSSGTVDNNIIAAGTTVSCATPGAGALSVDASSAGGVTADYNAFSAAGADDDYSWAGVAYPDPADFTSATGQGAHDVTLANGVSGVPPERSPAINSANCSAPGELGTDLDGDPWVSDPLATDASLGNGGCHASRGAYARQDSLPVTYTAPPIPPLDSTGYPAGVVPYTFGVTVTSATTSGWDEPVSYTVDFGDGSAPVPATPGTATTHQYRTPGEFTVTITAADAGGSTTAATDQVYALPVKPLAIGLSAAPGGLDAGTFTFSPGDIGTDDAENRDGEIARVAFTCGGTSNEYALSGEGAWQCVYATPGTYTGTLTVTDALGRTSTARATITVGDEPLHVFPRDAYSHEVAAHGVVQIPLSKLDEGNCCARGALVDVSVVSAKKAGYVTVYPNGTPRPGLPTVQFQAGRGAENSALATGSTVDFYNGSAGPIDLTIVSYGVDSMTQPFGKFGGEGEAYVPVTPVSVLSRTKISGGRQVTLRVAGRDRVPATAADVMLEITASGGASAGHFATSAAGDVPQYGGKAISVAGGYWAKGQQVTDLVMVPVDSAPAFLENAGPGSAYFTASVVGYYFDNFDFSKTASVFLPATPRRLDTVTIGAKRSVTLAVTGRNGIPATGATAVAVNLTASGATASGTIMAYADGTTLPAPMNLSYAAGATIANAAIVAMGHDGAIRLYNSGSRAVTVTVDLTGSYYAFP